MGNNAYKINTAKYEEWLGGIIHLDKEELSEKHKRIKLDRFEFLRATFYRWAQLWRKHENDLGKDFDKAPEVLGVGDLHVENFGTWRDADGRLAWGINDFDEACCLPYINDIVRLAVSTELALESPNNAISFQPSVTETRACDAILQGYIEGMQRAARDPDARRPYVLAEDHAWLRTIVLNKLQKKDEKGRTKFETLMTELTELIDSTFGEGKTKLKFPIPPPAREALLADFPPPIPSHLTYKIGQRTAGLGSLGRQRFTAVIKDWCGGLVAREAKALAPSAWLWAAGTRFSGDLSDTIWYQVILDNAVRASDPWVRVHRNWVVRRLAPDAGKIKLDDMPPELDEKLLCAMGTETANVHSWSRQPLQVVSADLKKREGQDKHWFRKAVDRMKAYTLEDWEDCKS
jgi:hypothetical protein